MNEKFYALPEEKQSQILNAAYKVFATNQYKKSPTSDFFEMMRRGLMAKCAVMRKYTFISLFSINSIIHPTGCTGCCKKDIGNAFVNLES